MRLLLDESVPARLKRALPAHAVRTVGEMGWSGVKNGKLLPLAATAFDAFVTVDKNMPYQQNPSTLPIAVVVLDAPSIRTVGVAFPCASAREATWRARALYLRSGDGVFLGSPSLG